MRSVTTDAYRGAGLAQGEIGSVKQLVVDEPAGKDEAAAGRQDCLARRLEGREREFDFLFEGQRP